MSIPDQLKKINAWTLAAICLVLGLSLAVGSLKLQAFEAKKQPVRIDSSEVVSEADLVGQGTQGITAAPSSSSQSQKVVASKSGTKYHFLSCPGAKTIVERNRVYFDSPAAAQKAGFTLAANCKIK